MESTTFLPPVNANDPISAHEQNVMRSILNALPGGSGASSGFGKAKSIRIPVYNAGSSELPEGLAVAIGSAASAAAATGPLDYSYPVSPAASAAASFAVLDESLGAGQCGSAIVLGVFAASVNIKSSSDGYAQPSSNGSLESCSGSSCKILWKAEGSGVLPCLLLLGAGGAAPAITQPTLASISGGSSGVYSVVLYANGYNQSSTGTGVIQALELCYGETLPSGTKVIAMPWAMLATGEGVGEP